MKKKIDTRRPSPWVRLQPRRTSDVRIRPLIGMKIGHPCHEKENDLDRSFLEVRRTRSRGYGFSTIEIEPSKVVDYKPWQQGLEDPIFDLIEPDVARPANGYCLIATASEAGIILREVPIR